MTTIAEISRQMAQAGVGTEVPFSFQATVQANDQAQRTNNKTGATYYQDRAQLNDSTGTQWMNTPQLLNQGEVVQCEGRAKKGQKYVFWDVRKATPAGAPQQQAPPPQQAQSVQSQPAHSTPTPKTLSRAARIMGWLCQESEGWGFKSDEDRRALVQTAFLGWRDGNLQDDQPGRVADSLPADDDVGF